MWRVFGLHRLQAMSFKLYGRAQQGALNVWSMALARRNASYLLAVS